MDDAVADETVQPSLFPPNEFTSTGMSRFLGPIGLGYKSEMIELAIRGDRIDMLQEAITNGWLDRECRAFDNQRVIDYCLYRNASKCAEYLRGLGWPEHPN